ncbi:class I SAM-dependent methyltransferase [Massilia niastensis]|uniref:class I SAM-dependent methyltransferase n=1 Tax=Massilia niastensis TaxID=544911 RepID=UPI00037BBAB4|nr:class I SAM-dependent methyltransferase [Massilia niastensis]
MNVENDPVAGYYERNAARYDKGYDRPERQDDLAGVRAQVKALLGGHAVLELGCGTGYWTALLDEVAASVVAVDASPAMVALARERGRGLSKVDYRVADAFDLPQDLERFSAVFVGFLWSHLVRERQEVLLAHLRMRLGKDVLLVLLDDEYVEGSSLTIARTDLQGNTFEIQADADGTRHELPKGYPTDSQLRKRLGPVVREIRIMRWDHYWMLSARLK